ncbi:MAG: SMP-30/gluconolactonase/LRE family protein [Acidimicrobiales bacterium]|jgi:gluconolactonase|nr:SMP-30/gluconolactonase/LRE family protein [Acidimicrobiales bacterium]
MGETRELASGLLFPEGPVAMPDGSVVLTEIARGTLTRVGADGSVDVVADCGGGPNGAAMGPDGRMYVANNGGRFAFHDLGGMLVPGHAPPTWTGGSIQRVDLDTGEVETLYESCDGEHLRAPNDLVFDAHGGFYFTDHGLRTDDRVELTGVYYAKADGSEIREVVAGLDSPNGVGLSPAGDKLYVAETHTGRVWSWDVTGPGEIAPGIPLPYAHGGALLHGAPGLQLFDSLAVDGEGWVCVATIQNGGITAISPDSTHVEHTAFEDLIVTNICFGGEDLRTAYVTLSSTGRLVATDWPRPGLRLAH